MILDAVKQIKGFGFYCAGNGLSIFGTGLWCTVLPWYVWRHTGSVTDLGWLSVSTSAPLMLCALGGIVADRMDRRKLLLVLQAVAIVLAALLTYETVSGSFHWIWLLTLNAGNSLVTAFEFPARQAIKCDIAGKELAASAISAYTTVDQAAFLLGHLAAGSIIALAPNDAEWICSLGNTISFLGALIALAVIRPTRAGQCAGDGNRGSTEETANLRSVLLQGTVFTLILQGLIVVVFAMRLQSLLPTYASEVHNYGKISGVLLFMVSLGSLAGPVVSGSLQMSVARGYAGRSQQIMCVLALLLGALMLVPSVVACAVLLALASMFISMHENLINTGIQLAVPQSLLGRILGWRGSLTWMMNLAAAPAASYVVVGYGLRTTILLCAGACLSGAWLCRYLHRGNPPQDSSDAAVVQN